MSELERFLQLNREQLAFWSLNETRGKLFLVLSNILNVDIDHIINYINLIKILFEFFCLSSAYSNQVTQTF